MWTGQRVYLVKIEEEIVEEEGGGAKGKQL
jgi:hypothetical protein